MNARFIALWLMAFFSTLSSTGLAQNPSGLTLTYGGRSFDLTSFVGLGDYMLRMVASSEDGSLYALMNSADGPKLIKMPYSNKKWTEDASEVALDFGKRAFWLPFYDEQSNSFYIISDNQNDEAFNVYRFDPHARSFTQMTNTGYAPNSGFSPEGTLIYPGRLEKTGPDICLEEVDPARPLQATRLYCDSEAARIYPYARPQITLKHVAFVTMVGESRSKLNLTLYDRQTGKVEVVTDKNGDRSSLSVLGWHEDKVIFITQNAESKPQLYTYSPRDKKTELLLANDLPIGDGYFSPKTNTAYVEFRSSDHKTGRLFILDLAENKPPKEVDTSDYKFWWSNIGQDLPDGAIAVSALKNSEWIVARIAPDEEDALQVGLRLHVNDVSKAKKCETEVVTYESFDGTDIQAILFKPIPEVTSEPAGIIFAHGGPSGQTTTDAETDVTVLCNLGYTVLGPNPRGSTGFGREFEDANNGDWGGADYRDYEYGRRYLTERYGIAESRIGIVGSSYGGYMTNWALTRPDNKFAFGISNYGMADLLYETKNSVVANNVTSDMGDPVANEALYRERSPMTWTADLNAPLLLSHGSRDFRATTEGTRRFYKALQDIGKDVTYIELDGEGHGYKYHDSYAVYLQGMLDFLWRVAPVEVEE